MAIDDEILAQASAAVVPMQQTSSGDASLEMNKAENTKAMNRQYANLIAGGKAQEAFNQAVRNRDVSGAESILNFGANVNGNPAIILSIHPFLGTPDPFKYPGEIASMSGHLYGRDEQVIPPPIFTAVANNDTAMIDMLARRGADMDARNSFKIGKPTVDHNGNYIGVSISKNDNFGQTPLQVALLGKDDEQHPGEKEKTVVSVLNNHGDIAATDQQGHNGMHYAVMAEPKVLDRVINAGGTNPAILEKRTVFDDTPLALIAQDPYKYSSNIPEAQAYNAQRKMLNQNADKILAAGADVNPSIITPFADLQNNQILTDAATNLNSDLVQKLLDHNADPRAGTPVSNEDFTTTTPGGITPLMALAQVGNKGVDSLEQLRVADKLLASTGVNIDAADEIGRTALMHAVEANNLPMVSFMLSKNTDVINTKDKNGKTAFDYAPGKKNPQSGDELTPMQKFLMDVKNGNRNPHNPLIEPDVDILPRRPSPTDGSASLNAPLDLKSQDGPSMTAHNESLSSLSHQDRALLAKVAAFTQGGQEAQMSNIAKLYTPGQSLPDRGATLST